MKYAFMCSLCRGGLIGGGLYLDAQAVTYRCQKLTVDPKFKRLVLPLDEIEALSWKQILFPLATFHMTSDESYTFLIFNKSRFEKHYESFRNPKTT